MGKAEPDEVGSATSTAGVPEHRRLDVLKMVDNDGFGEVRL